ncbi:unnamed protein product, partial [marine sediment metagenome]
EGVLVGTRNILNFIGLLTTAVDDPANNRVNVTTALPVFDTGWINRSDWTNVHLGDVRLEYDNRDGIFEVGEIITEEISGNTGIINSITATVLRLKEVTGTGVFSDNREITGASSGATADVDGTTKNVDNNVRHDLGAPLSDILVKVLISTDRTDDNSFDVTGYQIGRPTSGINSHGIRIDQVDTNNILIQTGDDGIGVLTVAGVFGRVNIENWYYKVKVYKLV